MNIFHQINFLLLCLISDDYPWERYERPYLSDIGWIVSQMFFYKEPMKVDMPLNKETKLYKHLS